MARGRFAEPSAQQQFSGLKTPRSFVSDLMGIEADYNDARESDRIRQWNDLARQYSQRQLTDDMYLTSVRQLIDPITNPAIRSRWETKFQDVRYNILQDNQKIEGTRIESSLKSGQLTRQQAYEAYLTLSEQSLSSGTRQGMLDSEVWKLQAVNALKYNVRGGGGSGRGSGSSLDTQDKISIMKAMRSAQNKTADIQSQMSILDSIEDGSTFSFSSSSGKYTLFDSSDPTQSALGESFGTMTPELKQQIKEQLANELVTNIESYLDSSDYWKAVNAGGPIADQVKGLSDSLISNYQDLSGSITNPWAEVGLEFTPLEQEVEPLPSLERESALPVPTYEGGVEEGQPSDWRDFLKGLFQKGKDLITRDTGEVSSAQNYKNNPLGTGSSSIPGQPTTLA